MARQKEIPAIDRIMLTLNEAELALRLFADNTDGLPADQCKELSAKLSEALLLYGEMTRTLRKLVS